MKFIQAADIPAKTIKEKKNLISYYILHLYSSFLNVFQILRYNTKIKK